MNTPTALIADDEPLLRDRLRDLLNETWPELDIVAEARNGRYRVSRYSYAGDGRRGSGAIIVH
jgi:YesN/AraC family two-component response regulator